MDEAITRFRERVDNAIRSVLGFCCATRDRQFQEAAVEQLGGLRVECEELKAEMIRAEREDEANAALSFESLVDAVQSELRMWLALKDGAPQAAWDHLVNAQGSVRTAMQAHDVGASLEPYAERLVQLEQLLFPPQVFMSIGMIVKRAECSVCGADYGTCRHVAGRPYCGVMCHKIITDGEAREVSFVESPANKHCRVMRVSDNGGWRDIMTWLPVPPDQTQDAIPDAGEVQGTRTEGAPHMEQTGRGGAPSE
mgnify:CR=1 FL=1